MWSADSADWTLNQTYASGDFVDPPYQGWTTQTSIDALEREMRDKTNADRGIIVLEHELSEESVEAFTRSYPKLKEHAWTTGAIPELEEGMLWYQ
jgi:16S rRNA G966 N2-methylase RsmD